MAARKITELGQGKVYGIVHTIKNPRLWINDIFAGIATSAGWPTSGAREPLGGGLDYRMGRYDFNHSGLRGSIQLWFEMRKDGSIFPGNLVMENEDAMQKFAQGLVGIFFGSWYEAWNRASMVNSFEYDATLPPTPKRGERKGYTPTQPLAVYSNYVVSSNVKNRDAVWHVIRFMTSQEYQEGWVAAGGGISVFPEYNKPAYSFNTIIAKFVTTGTAGTRTNHSYLLSKIAQKAKSYIHLDPIQEAVNIMPGMWASQLGWDAWDDLERRANAAFDKALSDAQKDGLMVTRKDFTFPDWDPAENYPPPKARK